MSLFFYFFALVLLLRMAFAYSKSRRPIFTAAKNAGSGLCRLLLVNLLSGRTGCYIPVNRRTVFLSTVLSMPGVLSLLVMKIFFNY